MPEVIQAAGTSRFLITHPRSLTGYAGTPWRWVQGWWLQPSGPATATNVSTIWSSQPRRDSVGAYSPVTQGAFVVWEVEEAGNPGLHDLFYGLVDRP